MRIIKPKYYDEFQCIADQCPYSCCIGWRVTVDKKSFQKYRKVQGKLKQKMNQCISRIRDEEASDSSYGKIKLNEQERCSFLNEQNLCEMYIELGEQSMCTVCKTYPRRLYQFGPICERSLTISCPEVAHMILNQVEPAEFIAEDENLTELDYDQLVKIELEPEVQLMLNDIRLLFITIAQYREMPIWKRLLLMRKHADVLDRKIKNGTYQENYFKVLYMNLKDKRVSAALDTLGIDKRVKNLTVDALCCYTKAKFGSSEYIGHIMQYAEAWNQEMNTGQINIEQLDQEFDHFMKDQDIFFEQYLVYYLFSHFMVQTDIKQSVAREITLLLVYYALLRYFMQVTWYYQKKQLSKEEMERIVYTFSRETEHNPQKMLDLKELEIMKTLESINCCSILLR